MFFPVPIILEWIQGECATLWYQQLYIDRPSETLQDSLSTSLSSSELAPLFQNSQLNRLSVDWSPCGDPSDSEAFWKRSERFGIIIPNTTEYIWLWQGYGCGLNLRFKCKGK